MENDQPQKKRDHHREWLDSLPDGVAEMLEATGETLSDFAGQVKMAQAITQIAFKRAVDCAMNPWANPTTQDGEVVAPSADQEEAATNRMALFVRANESAMRAMALRLEMQDKYKLVERTPLPMAIRLNVIQVAKEEQARRLALARPERKPAPTVQIESSEEEAAEES